MKYELLNLNAIKLPFIFRRDVTYKASKDYTHWHENIEILLFTEGEGYVICDFERYPVREGDIFIINSERLHMIESDDVIKYFCFIAGTDFCNYNGIPSRDLIFCPKIYDPVMTQKYHNLVKAFDSEENFREASIKVAALSLLVESLYSLENGDRYNKNVPLHLSNIKSAIKYIKENFSRKITIGDISLSAGLSRSYFSREFKKITGFSVVNYVNLVRCQYACKMLRSGKYKINEVAVECGFYNMSYFTRTYKKFMNVLPSEELQLT